MTRKITLRARYQSMLDVLQNIREDRALTQEEVSAQLGRYKTYISKVESGERRIDLIETLEILAVYKTPPESFLRRINRKLK